MQLTDARNTPSPEDIRKQAAQFALRAKEKAHAERAAHEKRGRVFTTFTNLGIIIQLFGVAALLWFAYDSSRFWITTGIFGIVFLAGYILQRLSVMIQIWNRDGLRITRLVIYQYVISWVIACLVYGAGVILRNIFE